MLDEDVEWIRRFLPFDVYHLVMRVLHSSQVNQPRSIGFKLWGEHYNLASLLFITPCREVTPIRKTRSDRDQVVLLTPNR